MSEHIAGDVNASGGQEAPCSAPATKTQEGDIGSAVDQSSHKVASGSTIYEECAVAVDSVNGTVVDTSAGANTEPASWTDPTRPSDEQILTYENELRAEQSKQRPLLGEKGPIESLRAEYADSSPIFVAKVAHLCVAYDNIRRTRQDGNCFYRCFIFGLLEGLLALRDAATTAAVMKTVQGLEATLETAGIAKLVWEDAMDVLMDLLKAVANEQDRITASELLLRLNSEDVCNMLVMFVRFVASAHIFTREDHFLPFILGTMDNCFGVDDFRRRYVEVMGEESDHIQVVPIEVIYLDNSPGADAGNGGMECNKHLLEPPQPPQGVTVPTVTVLYRPGHYDLVY